ncbi:MAG: DUF1302 domain-containing protein [Parvibaculum sp.]|uniref:DUF1302 domain-containing protein n=1 Tax=Parvibaculum sp. TaxID=2024848 RepID=UPI0025CCF541|nr:DUF1302 family protein [Parvibaculum sp.]MCE9648305.1 DUF1302 domain-containing protein [Parvibaculum sp.]
MIKGSLRSLLLGSAVSVGLVASAGTANAIQYNFGEFTLGIDTTVSAGASMGTSGTSSALLPTSNGGPLQATGGTDVHISGAAVNGVTTSADGTANSNAVNAPGTLTGSINSDDGRLNFGRGDLWSGVVKMTNDFSGSFQNYKFFARLSSYYDAVLARDSSYDRMALTDGKADAARDIKLLDFYGSADYNIGDLPLNIRAGKQVISWGESTFIQNGINVINPVDVSAARRPGSELKEFFIPVWAADASIGLPFNLSLEAFYQFKWDTYALDRGGTPFAGSDGAAIGSTPGGASFLTGGPGGAIFSNCSTPNGVTDQFNSAYALSGNAQHTCGSQALDYSLYNSTVAGLGGWDSSNTEAIRLAYGDNAVVHHGEDDYAKNSGQWGVAARWYSEDLNNTEFGVYFMNYHSRLPFVNEKVSKTNAAWGTSVNGGTTSSTLGRTLQYSACNRAPTAAGDRGQAITGTDTTDKYFGSPLGLSAEQVQYLNEGGIGSGLSDPDGVYAAAESIAQAYYGSATPTDGGNYNVVAAPVDSMYKDGGAAGLSSGSLSAGTFRFDDNFSTNLAADTNTATGALGAGLNGVTVNRGSVLEALILNCALIANQSVIGAGGVVTQADGAEILGTSDLGLSYNLVYPEDIKMVGASFNTTLGTWGVQGEVSYRPDAPFQLDTDQMTIAALASGCVFDILFGPSNWELAYKGAQTLAGNCGSAGLGSGASQTISGVVKSKMWTAQVGTTATYSNSNALVSGLGADLGILVTEVGVVYVPDAQTTGSQGALGVRWANVCTTGTDLPLGSLLSLASRSGCRPDKASWGYVLLGQLQYNNAFGTAVTLSPTMAFSHDVSGNTPSPYGNYREGRKSVSLQLNGSYQGAWRGGISYTNFFGNEKYTSTNDRDYAAVNLSYAF